ncbi:Cullin-associated Nedd8-dissociated protein 1 [Trichinella nelsoni]|uniref:Cullin-associated Nedd8-dissociated protein 1 n=1 Tax=Trichinella nelsoni TaxID=6336 RepID=A0A0V0S5C2_9BILA|nr:Cullin-associated Nedd8-dissociated protein 1 [Trichinella nelsoni]
MKLTIARKLSSIPFFIGMSWKAKLDNCNSVVMIGICISYFMDFCNMSAVSYYIAHLLERMNSADKDFRFMATNDLMRELQKEITLDVDSENKMVEMLLKLLEDKNTEVQNLAVRCMGPLIRKVKDAQAANVTCILSANLRSEISQKRDVSSSALKTIINELPPTESAVTVAVLKAIMPALLSILSSADADMSVLLECLDMVNSVLGRFPSVVGHHYAAVECTVLPLLEFDRAPVRKRAILVLSTLSGICDNAVLGHLGQHLLDGLSKLNESSIHHRTYIACTGAVCKSAGSRLGTFLSQALPAIVHYCKEMQDDEIRESCFAAFEQLLLFCSKQCDETVVDEILKLAIIYVGYDPNYQYDYEMQDASMELDDDDVDDMDSQLSAEEYSDDDDMSWKVRRAAAKCLEAAVNTRRNRIFEFHQTIIPRLIERFKEREESVRCDLFNVLLSLLKRTRVYFQYSSKSIAEKEQKTIIASLESQMPALIVPLQRHLGGKSYKTKQAVFSVLSELQALAPQVLAPFLGSLLLNVRSTLSEKQTVGGVKIDALIFLRSAITAQTLDVVALQIPVIAPLLRQCIQDAYYKVSAEALAVVQKLLTLIRNGDGEINLAALDLDNMRDLYNCILAKLKDTCLDREVKEPSIMCVALYIATFGNLLQDGLDEGLQMLFDRIKNELTRLVGVRAFSVVLKSPLNLSLQSVVCDLVVELTTFLRKNQRSLRVDSLELLELIFQRSNSTQLASHHSAMVQNLVLELAPLLGQGDLQLATLAADNLTRLMPIAPELVLDNYHSFVDPAIALLRSPLLSGHYLNKLIVFFQQFWQQASKLEKITFQEFKQLLLAPVAGEPRPHNFAKCFAALILIQPDTIKPTVAELCRELDVHNCPDANEQARQFALLTLGEIGALCSIALNDLNVEGIVMNAFENPDERVKEAASQALGRVGTGNLARYLPFIVQQIQQATKQQYLFMLSLLEIINHFVSAKSLEPLQQYVEFIWKVLLNHAECNEEGVRNVIAECLGKLCLLQPANLLPQLRSNLNNSTNTNVRNTLTSSIKYTLTDQMPGIDEYLKDCIGDFFQMLKDSDLNIRRIAFLTFNSFVHNKPELMRDQLSNLLPVIYSETAVRKELIREVDMGPFKHVMDDGLHLRKAAFECMYTLLDNCFDCLDVFEFLNHVVQGLKDHYDIKILTFLIVIRLTTLCPNELLQRLINIVEPLKQVCLTKLKTNSVKQEYELQDELKRSALRAVIAIQNLPTAGKHPIVVELMNIINQTPELLNLYENVRWDPLTSKH